MRKFSTHGVYLIFILSFSILGMKALFHPGLFTAHDIWHQVVRLYYYSQAINDGQFPPYWIGQLANRFGYPLFFFSYHLPWIIGVNLTKIGINISDTIKTLFFLSFLGSGLTMYLFVNNLLKNKSAAFLSSLLYLWLPYHFLIIFVSASMGIAFVFTFLPLIFLGIHSLKEGQKLGIPILAIGLSGVILSHIMHLVFLFPVILIFFLWSLVNTTKRVVFLKNIVFSLILGILVSSFYLIPAFYYNKFTRVHQETGFFEIYKRNFINFNQLIYSKWSYSPIVNNAKNGEVSFQLGFAQWISILFLIYLIVFKKLTRSYPNLSICLLIGFVISIFLMLDFSQIIWSFLVKFTTVDFPFRLLLPATFIASISAGIIFVNTGKKMKFFLFIFLIIVALYSNRNHLNVNQYTNFPISTYLNLETEITTNTFNEYLPVHANAKLLNKPWNEAVGNNLTTSLTKQTTNSLSFNLDARETIASSFGQFYFPGQTLYLDGKLNQFNIDREGKISLTVPKGPHIVKIKYQKTLLITFSKYLTLIGILITLLLLFKPILRKKFTSYQP